MGATMNQAIEFEVTTPDPIVLRDGNFFSVRLETNRGTIRLRFRERALQSIADQLKDLPRPN
jgi:hypothetical protein